MALFAALLGLSAIMALPTIVKAAPFTMDLDIAGRVDFAEP